MCARVVPSPRIQYGEKVRHGLTVLRHGAEVALLHDAAHVLVGPRFDPHRVSAAQEQRIGLRIGNNAAGRRDDRALVPCNDPLESCSFLPAKRRETRDLNEIGEAGAIVLLDDAVELDERYGERPGEAAPERRFARTPQTDQGDAARAVALASGMLLDQV